MQPTESEVEKHTSDVSSDVIVSVLEQWHHNERPLLQNSEILSSEKNYNLYIIKFEPKL